jgi:hypothetical protein
LKKDGLFYYHDNKLAGLTSEDVSNEIESVAHMSSQLISDLESTSDDERVYTFLQKNTAYLTAAHIGNPFDAFVNVGRNWERE